jgi:hypothetical protein
MADNFALVLPDRMPPARGLFVIVCSWSCHRLSIVKPVSLWLQFPEGYLTQVKRTMLLCNGLLVCSLLASASPMLITGTPGNANLGTGPSLIFGPIVNFDSLTPNTTLNPAQFAAQGITSISSPDGLTVEPYSTQSFPNDVVDNGVNGVANISIKLSTGSNEIGIGIADSDPVSITLQALGLNGSALGSAFSVTLPSNTINPYNGYFAIADSGYAIGGLEILQTSANASYSGLAIDDLQVAPTPEPASFVLAGAGLMAFGLTRLRRKAAANHN